MRLGRQTAVALLAAALCGAAGVSHADPPSTAGADAPADCAWVADPGGVAVLKCKDGEGGWLDANVDGFDASTLSRAPQGDAVAMRVLARFYLYGRVPQFRDAPKAVALLEVSAAKGDVGAMVQLAIVYRDGVGLPKDYAKAVRWFRSAAEGGDAEAMYQLGSAYIGARGVAQDYVQAVRWLTAAADRGDDDAMLELGQLAFAGEGMPHDQAAAAKWFRRAADAQNPAAMFALSYLYERGLGVAQNKDEAQRWRKAAAVPRTLTSVPPSEALQTDYPVEAAAEGVSGKAFYDCHVGVARTFQDCHLIQEAPPGLGFGEAGYRLIPSMRLGPGIPVGAEVHLPVNFSNPTGGYGAKWLADDCAAEGVALARRRKLGPVASWEARYWMALSRYDARQAGEADSPDRLQARIDAADGRLAKGKDSGLFGMINKCSLK